MTFLLVVLTDKFLTVIINLGKHTNRGLKVYVTLLRVSEADL